MESRKSAHGPEQRELGALPYFALTALMLRLGATVAVAATVTFALAARPGEHREGQAPLPTTETPAVTPTPAPPRAGVPSTARDVTGTLDVGSTLPIAPEESVRLFFSLRCDGDLLTVATTRETVYAEVACNRYWLPFEVQQPFWGRPVRIRVEPGDPVRLSFEVGGPGGTARFEAERVWIEQR